MATDPSHLTSGDLVNGLPPSWRAKILDAPTQSDAAKGHVGKGTFPVAPPNNGAPAAAGPAFDGAAVDQVLLPIPSQAGIAAFESGDRLIIVVDNAFPMDTSTIHGSGFFASLTVSLLPDATLIQLKRDDTRQLFLYQRAEGWVLGDKAPPNVKTHENHVINPSAVNEGILYPMRRSGRVLTVADPSTNERLLVGTSLLDDGGILAMRHAQGYDVWPTLEGVVIAARDPDIALVAVQSGLLLNRDGRKFEDDGQSVYANDVDLKWLGLQDLPDAELLKRYHDRLLKAADSQPADRFDKRIDAARVAFSMGAFMEARGILTVALRDDPEEVGRPEVRFLLAATELMLGFPKNASALDGPWPEKQQRALQLWRALYLEAADQSDSRSVHRLALDLDRVRAYPTNLRDLILPLVAEAIARHGDLADLPALDRLPDQPAYRLARALASQRQNNNDRAYAELSALSTDRDLSLSEKASEAKILLDHDRGKLTTEQTVKALDDLILDARLAGRERNLRLTQAEIYAKAKQWQNAAQIIDQGVPHRGPSHYSTRRNELLLQALQGVAAETNDAMSKEELVKNAALLKAHMPALPQGPARASLLAAYGRILLSLGLSDDATQALSEAIPALETPESKADAGASLAEAALTHQQPEAAAAALDRTESTSLPQPLQAHRDLIRAKIALMKGDKSKGLGLLKNTSGLDARLLGAQFHENQGQWLAAAAELRAAAMLQIPAQGDLDKSQQDLALRLASDASRAGDKNSLQWISDRIGKRSLDDTHAKLFSVLRQSGADDASLNDDERAP